MDAGESARREDYVEFVPYIDELNEYVHVQLFVHSLDNQVSLRQLQRDRDDFLRVITDTICIPAWEDQCIPHPTTNVPYDELRVLDLHN